MSRRLSVTATYDMFGALCDAFLGHFGFVRRGLWLSSSGRLGAATDPESLWAFGLELHLARSPVRLDIVVDSAWQLGSVDPRSRLAKQSRGVDHRRIAIQRKRKVQIVTKVVNSGASKGPFLAK